MAAFELFKAFLLPVRKFETTQSLHISTLVIYMKDQT